MKKVLKFVGIILLIAGAAAGVWMILKKLNIFNGCDLDCDNCNCNCSGQTDDEDDEDNEADAFDSREYVSIQPQAQETEEAVEESEEN